MKETNFIEQNKEKWLKFEQLLRLNRRDPDKLSDLFIQITDDLSYARTNYPNRSIRIYLNNLAQQLFYSIYKNKKERKNRFMLFWKEELPSVVYHSRTPLLISFIVFLLSSLIGVVSSIHDPDFARSILGESYVEMTIQNIEEGDPMGVYKKMNEVDMFLGITLNNVLVAFRTFITGIFFSLGSVIILIYNGIMVGTFQYFFIERDLVQESFLTIWLHGTLEISSIIIAGAAGIVLGKGFAFPGTYSRLRAFQMSARKGLKLLLGIVPILVFAALIESFVTRYTELPDEIKLTLIVASLAFMILYFIWYPYTKYKNGTLITLEDGHLQPKKLEIPAFSGIIKPVNTIFKDTLLVYGKIFKPYIRPMFLASLIYMACVAYILLKPVMNGLIHVDVWVFTKLLFLLDYLEYPLMFFINVALLSGIVYMTLQRITGYLNIDHQSQKLLLNSIISAFLINIPFFLDGFLSFLTWVLVFPVAIFCVFISLKEQRSYFSSALQFSSFLSHSFGRILGLFTLILFIGFIFFVLIDSPFFAFYMDFIQDNFALTQEIAYYVGLFANGLVMIIGLVILLPLFLIGFSIQYFSLLEIQEADWLKQQIRLFGKNGKE